MAPRPNMCEELNNDRKRDLVHHDTRQSRKRRCVSRLNNRITRTRKILEEPSRKFARIFTAAEEGDLITMKELIHETGAAIRDLKCNETLLHVAAANNRAGITSYLLTFINPNVVNNDLQTPAHLAAANGQTEALKVLLADDDFNPDQKDTSQRIYKDLLASPLFKAVLRWNKKGIEELLQLGADPDHQAGGVANGTLARELRVTTSRQLAIALGRKAIVDMFPGMTVPELDNNYEKDRSQVVSGQNNFRGYVSILNFDTFQNKPELTIEASNKDVMNLAKQFSKTEYKTSIQSNLSAQKTKEYLKEMRNMDLLNDVTCAIFFISGHGVGNEQFLTSDNQLLNIEWVLNLFNDSQCPQLRGKPKLFIFDLSQGHYNDLKEDHLLKEARQTLLAPRVQEPLQDVMCLYSCSNGFTSNSFSKDGSDFCMALCRTLKQHSYSKEFHDIYRELLLEYRKCSPSAVPQLRNIGFTNKFYF